MARDAITAFTDVFPGTLHALTGLVARHGLLGLFAAAFVGSTIFVPLTVEFLFAPLIELNVDLYLIVIVASIGALMGTWVNYWLGYYCSELIEKRVGKAHIDKAKNVMDKYGWPGLFLIVFAPIPLPIPVDPITIIPGIARMNFVIFSVVVFIAKLMRYAFFVGVLNSILCILFPNKPVI